MDLVKSIILGIVQGFTEFLPVSSSGHLLVLRKWFGLAEAGLFLDTMLHFGTLIALVIIFWRDIWKMICNPLSKMTLLVIAATLPTAAIGIIFRNIFEELAVSGRTVGWEFLATGLVLWVADMVKDRGTKDLEEIGYKDALFVGVLQGVAILPAISRSGLTIAGSFFRGINRAAAARFSFLVSIPAIMGAVVLQGKDLFDGKAEAVGMAPMIWGTLAAAVTGYIAVKWMLKIIRQGSLRVFSIYVWILGCMVLLLQYFGVM